MVRPFTLWSALLVVTGLVAQHSENLIVHFEPASALVRAEDEASLHALCRKAGKANVGRIKLEAHTDVLGNAQVNMLLSIRRGDAVRNILQKTCLSGVPLEITDVGESRPLNNSLGATDHAANRRVEVLLEYDTTEHVQVFPAQRHPHVEPLMPGADVAHEFFRVDPAFPIEFIASDGVRVRIPANAIMDRKGSVVTGLVDISYRSFNDPWSIIASGIPMHVGERDHAGHMESLGMYEVYASQGGGALSLREGEVISVTKASTEIRTAEYRDWTLDEATGQWRDEGSRTEQALAEQVNVMYDVGASMACAGYVNAIRRLPLLPDSTDYLARLASASYCHTEPCGSAVKPYTYEDGKVVSPYSNKAIPAIQLIVEKGVYRGQHVAGFRVHLRNEPNHTEWRAFPMNRIWAYDGPLSRRRFAEKFARKHYYQDIALEVSEDGTSGTLRLKDRGAWVELPLDLTFHQSNAADAKAFRTELIAYQARSEAKRTRFDRRLEVKLDNAKEQEARGKERAWREARRVMRDEELAMTANEFDAYAMSSSFAKMPQRSIATSTAGGQLELSFAIRGFGIYNCDQILKRESIQPQQVAVLDAEGTYFPWLTAYGLLEGRRSVITYWGDGSGTSTNMRLSKDMSSLVFVGRDGDLLVVEQPGSLLRSGKITLKGQPLPQPRTPQELGTMALRQ